ncbi:MAG: hypothetical protein NTU80_01275 [Verrucomicrobia bacterium]|nr:hypothetical protein [Verrucomicrobiota bacterium]
MSSLVSSLPAPSAKTPFLAGAAFFSALAGFIAWLAIKPLGAAELLGIAACSAATGAAATFPFAVDFARRLTVTPPTVCTETLATRVAELLEENRQTEIRAAVAATPPRVIDSDTVATPAGTKPRLGRGLLGLMHAPGAVTPPPTPQH